MSRAEEVKVGLFVLVALGLLVAALVLVGGMNLLQEPRKQYTLRTAFAGGIDEGAAVRYAGIKVGRVIHTGLDREDPSRVEVKIEVDQDTPVRTDSTAEVSSLGMLGEYYVEIYPGTKPAEDLPSGSELPVRETVRWSELVNRFGATTREAENLMADIRPRLTQVMDNVKKLTDEDNRRRVERVLIKMDQILTDAQPRIRTVLSNLESGSEKVDTFLEEIRGTRAQLDELLQNWNELAEGEDAQVQMTLRKLREALGRAEEAMGEIQRLLAANREHLDVTMENIRISTENIRQFTDTIKQRPYSLVRVKEPSERRPGEQKEED